MTPKTKRRRRQETPLTLEDVDRFLDSPVARRYFAFSDSNVKRRVVRMLLYLREEVDRLSPSGEAAARPWTQRLGKRHSTGKHCLLRAGVPSGSDSENSPP